MRSDIAASLTVSELIYGILMVHNCWYNSKRQAVLEQLQEFETFCQVCGFGRNLLSNIDSSFTDSVLWSDIYIFVAFSISQCMRIGMKRECIPSFF